MPLVRLAVSEPADAHPTNPRPLDEKHRPRLALARLAGVPGVACRGGPFDSDRSSEYVPLRLPSTLCLQERLPAGAAAVVLNRSHPYPDLILALNSQEKRMFDAIDGRRTVKQIVDYTNGPLTTARALFQNLWWYDQVTFDASGLG